MNIKAIWVDLMVLKIKVENGIGKKEIISKIEAILEKLAKFEKELTALENWLKTA